MNIGFTPEGKKQRVAIADGYWESISDLRKVKKISRVVVFASRSNARIYDLFDGLDDIVIVPLTSPLNALKKIKEYEVDVLIDTSQWPRISAILAVFHEDEIYHWF